jgi:hypothetical protein
MGAVRIGSLLALIFVSQAFARQTGNARRQAAGAATQEVISTPAAPTSPSNDKEAGDFSVSDCHLHGTDV